MRKGFSITQEGYYLDGIIYSENDDFLRNFKLNKLVDHVEEKVYAGENKIIRSSIEYTIKQLFYTLDVVNKSAIVKLTVDVFNKNDGIVEKIAEISEACTADEIMEKMIEMYDKML